MNVALVVSHTCTAESLSSISAAFTNLAERISMQLQRYVLMLEEDPDDRQITQTVINDLNIDVQLHFVKYSHELFNKLQEENKPSLILIDYNATPSPAVEVLKELRSKNEYRHIPTVVLGEGLPEHFIKECYALGANSYILKPSSEKATEEKIETFFRYWLNVVEMA